MFPNPPTSAKVPVRVTLALELLIMPSWKINEVGLILPPNPAAVFYRVPGMTLNILAESRSKVDLSMKGKLQCCDYELKPLTTTL